MAAAAPCWQHLQQLKFAKCGPYIAKAVIAGAANWRELLHLDLSGAAMDMSTWVDVAPVLKDLRNLNFRDTMTNEYDGAPGLAKAARHWSRLQHVDLSENFFFVGRVTHLGLGRAAREWGQLQDLHLCLNVRQGGDSIGFAIALVDIGQDWQHLKRLDMPNNHLGLDGMQALVLAVQHWQELEHLCLARNSLDVESVRLLTQCWPQLTYVDLSHNSLGCEGAAALAGRWYRCNTWPWLIMA